MELLKSVVAWDLHPIHMENVQGALLLCSFMAVRG